MRNDNIFKPLALPNGVELKNRIMMAPMTTCSGFYEGSVTHDLIEYYRARAGEIGTIIVECGFVDNKGLAFPGAIGLDHDDKIEGLAKIAKAIKEKGSKAVIQVYHGGRMVEPKLIGGQSPVGPSAIAAPRPGAATPIELTADEVDEMIDKFGQAVRRAIQAGFDGVEIHGANTYLIQQFYSPNSNQRTDKWGGSRDNRARFPLAVLDITHNMFKKYASPDFIVGYRFSPEELEIPGIRFDDSMYLLEKLAEKGLDYVHFSMGAILRPSIVETNDPTPLINKYVAMRSQTLAKIPVVGVGNVVNISDVEAAMDNGFDLVAVGRACIAYPDWLSRVEKGEKLELFINSDKREELNIPEPLWHFSLVESLIRDVNLNVKKFKPGNYQEKVNDESYEYVINVELGKDFVKDMQLLNANDFDSEVVNNFSEIKHRIIDSNSPHVDAISGATSQCEAFKKAVTKAMAKSNKEAILAEGGDPNDKAYDVVVVGSGGAGLSAAIQAHDLGASVVVVEKMPVIGGNTNKASAGMNAAETKFQKLKGIVDSKDLFYKETLTGGKNKNNPELLRYFVENAPDAIDWLDNNGIELSGITTTGGMSIDRTHRPASGAAVGGFLISGLQKNINRRGIEVMLDTNVTEILTENHKVVGVKVSEEDGSVQTIKAKAVIIATGGFSANREMVEKYRPDLKGFVTTNHKGATGSGIMILEKLGAGTVDMKEIQIHPTVEQTTSYLISESIRGGGAILVSQKGQRFVNELDTRDKVSAEIINLPEHYAYILFDQQVRNENKAVEEYVSHDLVVQADTIKDLADKLSIDSNTLSQTIERYNQFAETKRDEDFGRTTGMRHPINKGPFYAIKIAPGVHHTMGGVTINTETQVLDTDKHVIQGVFAAGEVVGGVHGANRIGGNAVADIIIFGMQAGRKATDYINH
ncbi:MULTISPECIES: flavocytochrome c [unclassified Gilliamella]|uniref:flavocytochrome c n=1 Tax=unclassified Gilliamella TaxID=2685620 RepID=UPI002269EF25|nr:MULTISPECIES: flavocytochrome c [unclassified Gilliamella]MCX8601413.1 flavocytochrome c [Gilliamella sp. B3722]MCX8608942.1 flavocytochrome c [Gilliamella sp. B3771]MCX8610617.1 flavocytochrome c [Gilliamella sp. B3891]MCX8613144.1 flavocytochrome c [Gilliamella sp. B3773]MCX8615359.1 flavocytochrome c [Gilliamella sp. B3770]